MVRFDFGHIPIRECGEPLVLVEPRDFIQEPKYFEQGLSQTRAMFLRPGTLERLRKAQRNLPKGYRLKLWDCYRSLEVQRKLFEQLTAELIKEDPAQSPEHVFSRARTFVSIPDRPEEVPPHNTGGTVDLTVVNETEEELNMGTDFDEFGEACRALYFDDIVSKSAGDEIIARNREILHGAMGEAGFIRYADEWWHFDYGNQPWALESGEPFAIYGSADSFLPQ